MRQKRKLKNSTFEELLGTGSDPNGTRKVFLNTDIGMNDI